MSEWPEALIERIANAMYEEEQKRRPSPGQTIGPLADIWFRCARAALDALGLREETDVHWSGAPQHRYVTGWEDV